MLYEHNSSSVSDPGRVGAPDARSSPITTSATTSCSRHSATVTARGAERSSCTTTPAPSTGSSGSATAGESFRSLSDSTNYGFRWRETATPWTGGELVLGLDNDFYGGEFVERRTTGDQLATDLTFRNTAPYAMLSHSFGGSVTVTPSVGVRYNDSRYFGSEWGGQAGVTVGFLEPHRLRELGPCLQPSGGLRGSPVRRLGSGRSLAGLSAETIDHLEVGLVGAAGRTMAARSVAVPGRRGERHPLRRPSSPSAKLCQRRSLHCGRRRADAPGRAASHWSLFLEAPTTTPIHRPFQTSPRRPRSGD